MVTAVVCAAVESVFLASAWFLMEPPEYRVRCLRCRFRGFMRKTPGTLQWVLA